MKYRKHIRLNGYDYSSPNYYFVTVCTKDRRELFCPRVSEKYGEVFKLKSDVAAASYAAENTATVIRIIHSLENKYYKNLTTDFNCIMPDHIHTIVIFQDKVYKKGAIRSRSYSLSDVIRAFKALVSRSLGYTVFQPNYYEHIIRNDSSLDRIRRYILNNPMVEYADIDWKRIDP